ncbi:MAG: hypothetical protein LC754_11085 [Acidobacteria bacterium]|nr:hypothetical protein [Acidobacteriota bacterium]
MSIRAPEIQPRTRLANTIRVWLAGRAAPVFRAPDNFNSAVETRPASPCADDARAPQQQIRETVFQQCQKS